MKPTKRMLKRNPKVDRGLLTESLKLSKKLARAGIRGKRFYSLPSPFDNRLTTTTVTEHLASKKKI
jgi:hypothetical protein